jgi:hypothetical protein
MKKMIRATTIATTTTPMATKIITTVLDLSLPSAGASLGVAGAGAGLVSLSSSLGSFPSTISSLPTSLTTTFGFSITGGGLGTPERLKLATLLPKLMTSSCWLFFNLKPFAVTST